MPNRPNLDHLTDEDFAQLEAEMASIDGENTPVVREPHFTDGWPIGQIARLVTAIFTHPSKEEMVALANAKMKDLTDRQLSQGIHIESCAQCNATYMALNKIKAPNRPDSML